MHLMEFIVCQHLHCTILSVVRASSMSDEVALETVLKLTAIVRLCTEQLAVVNRALER